MNTDEIRNILLKLYEKKNNLLIRISGLSDYILSIQAKEEYDLLEIAIQEKEELFCNTQFREMAEEHTSYYTELFIHEPNIIRALEVTNELPLNYINNITKNNRIRIPLNARDRRAMTQFAMGIKMTIVIKDLESKILDVINGMSNTIDNVNGKLVLFVGIISRWQDYEKFTTVNAMIYCY